MNLTSILAMLKSLAPILEPIGEQGVEQLWITVDAEIAKIAQQDAKDVLTILSPAVKQCILIELRKLTK